MKKTSLLKKKKDVNSLYFSRVNKFLSTVLAFILLLLAIIQIFSGIIYAEEPDKLNVVYFYSHKCLACKENTNFVAELKARNDINFYEYDASSNECSDLQLTFAKAYNVSETYSLQIPALYFDKSYYILSPNNYDEILTKIDEFVSEKKEFYNFDYVSACSGGYEELTDKMTISGVICAGILDGINPCAISMLLIFFSFLACCEKKKRIAFMAGAFILGLFAVNLSFGLGFSLLYDFIAGNSIVLGLLFGLSLLLCIIAIVINSSDIYNVLKKTGKEAKNQLTDNTKFRLVTLMKNVITSKWAIFAALVVGILIGGIELACTGQIYLPTLTYMVASNTSSLSSIFLLLIYNLCYIMPLVIVTIIAAVVKDAEKLKSKIMKKNYIMKIAANVFFLIMAAIMLQQIISLF